MLKRDSDADACLEAIEYVEGNITRMMADVYKSGKNNPDEFRKRLMGELLMNKFLEGLLIASLNMSDELFSPESQIQSFINQLETDNETTNN